MNIFEYKRIVIVGNNGSGKSFFARELSAVTGLPLIHLDLEFWGPNWEMPTKDAWKQRNIALISKDAWILDGNVDHGGTIKLRFEAADLVVFLDINRLVCLISAVRRNGKKRSDTLQYRNEKFDQEFLHFCKGIWQYPKTRRRMIQALHCQNPDKPFFVIKNRRQMKKLLSGWKRTKASLGFAQ